MANKVIFHPAIMNDHGDVIDRARRPLATRQELADAIFEVAHDYIPGQTLTLVKKNGVWPPSPTDREDIVIWWKGTAPFPPSVSVRTFGVAEMLEGVDFKAIVET
jgi:hypothetical protein